ncbi:MAG: hypothetical protein COY19_04270 [Candidatus Marinimicrobia bacterium CG_4_10_14_0_2_um_filter_48_9]|nr:MAG: hypothetical protein COY19_04270 [Candidatus Marinimicrobia bacterium CG_4_10_14_0_2_um_filter_48_9]
MKKLTLLLVAVLALILVVACSDDSSTNNNNNTSDPWVGTWLSTGTNVAPLLAYYFNLDSVEVTLGDDQSVALRQHSTTSGWSALSGTYAITESTGSEIDAISIIYTTFSQEGIVKVDADSLWLEAVQTVPDIGATVPTPANGFGADATLGVANIQKYIRQN